MKHRTLQDRKISFQNDPYQTPSLFQNLRCQQHTNALQRKFQQLTFFQLKSLEFLSQIFNQQKQTNLHIQQMFAKDHHYTILPSNINIQSPRENQFSADNNPISRANTLTNNQNQRSIANQLSHVSQSLNNQQALNKTSSYLDFKVQSSKQKLINDKKQIMDGLQKVLSNLKGQKKVHFKTDQAPSLQSSIDSPKFKHLKKSKDNDKINPKSLGAFQFGKQSQQFKINLNQPEQIIQQHISQQNSHRSNFMEKIKTQQSLKPQIIIHTVEDNRIKNQQLFPIYDYTGLRKPPKMKTFIKSNADSAQRQNQDIKKSNQCSKQMEIIRKEMRKSGRRQSAYIGYERQKSQTDQSDIAVFSPKRNLKDLFLENNKIDMYIQESYEITQSARFQGKSRSQLLYSKGKTNGKSQFHNFDVLNLKIQKSHIYEDEVLSQNIGIVEQQQVQQSMVKVNFKTQQKVQSGKEDKEFLKINQTNILKQKRRPSIQQMHGFEESMFDGFDYNATDEINQQQIKLKHLQSENPFISSSNNISEQLKFAHFNDDFPIVVNKTQKKQRKRRMSLANDVQLKQQQKRIEKKESSNHLNLLNLPLFKMQSKSNINSPKEEKSSIISQKSRQSINTKSRVKIPLNISNNDNSPPPLKQFLPLPGFQQIVKSQVQIGKKIYDQSFKAMKNYSRLGDIQGIADKRQMKIKISFYDMCKNANVTQFQGKKQLEIYIGQWLGIVFRSIASVNWNLLQSKALDFDEIKILFTENVIFNFIELMKDIRFLGLNQYVQFIPEVVNKKSIDIINFLCKQYPQTKIQAPNLALKNQVPQIDQKGRIQYQLLRNSNVCFKFKKNRDYSSQIMQFINYLIDTTNKQYDEFEKFMNNFFTKLYIPQSQRTKSNIFNSKQLNKQQQKTIAYQEKVKKYTKFLIGRKIPKNTAKYTQQQIDNGIFFVKSSQILRVLSKWVQQLTQVIKNPQAMIKDWFYPFKNHHGDQQYAQYPIRKGIYLEIVKSRQDLLVRMQNIRKQCYRIQGQLSQKIHISDPQSYSLSQQQINVGLFSSNIKNAISSYLCQQLNQVIHFLLAAPLKVDEKKLGVAQYFQQKTRNQLSNINLITFRIFDLLRCKCISGQAQIIWLVNQLKDLNAKSAKINSFTNISNSSNKKDDFKIVRCKDRLNLSSRDILINAKIGNSPVFQIQLSMSNTVGQKHELLDKYNHFLYQLRRATMLGSLVQSISIWTSLQQKSLYFEQHVQKKFSKADAKSFDHKCTQNNIKRIMQPIICVSCNVFFHIPRTCLMNWVCLQCRSTVCGQCFYLGLNPQDRKKFLIGKSFNRQFLNMLKQYKHLSSNAKSIDISKGSLPKNIFFIKKDSLKPELNYMTTYSLNQSSSLGNIHETDQVTKAVQSTIGKSGKIINKSLFSNMHQMNIKTNSLIMFQFNPHGRRQFLTVQQIRKLDINDNNKLRFVDLMHQPNYLSTTKQYTTMKKKQRYLLNLQIILGSKRRIEIVKIKRTVVLLQPCLDYKQLERQIMCRQNLLKLQSFAQSSSTVVSIQKRNMTIQMDMLQQQIGADLYNTFSKNLTKIYLNYGFIKSIQSLSSFINVQSLYISNNQLSSLKGIQSMKKLKILNFDRNRVQSLDPISNLIQLEYIAGNQNNLVSLLPIKKLIRVKDISFHGNQIKQIQSMEKLNELQVLFLTQNKIQRIKGLSHLKKIQKLALCKILKIFINLASNNIYKVQSIKNIPTLKQLILCHLNLQQIPQEISQIFSLYLLDLSDNKIKKIQRLQKLKDLKILNLKNNQIKKIQGLQNLKIVQLNLDDNQITSLNGISNFIDSLESLSIRRCPIQDCGDLKDTQVDFKIYWTKNSFKPKARFQLQTIFKQDFQEVSAEKYSLLRSTTLKSSKNLSQSRDLGLKYN